MQSLGWFVTMISANLMFHLKHAAAGKCYFVCFWSLVVDVILQTRFDFHRKLSSRSRKLKTQRSFRRKGLDASGISSSVDKRFMESLRNWVFYSLFHFFYFINICDYDFWQVRLSSMINSIMGFP